jgi:hypothetical protein
MRTSSTRSMARAGRIVAALALMAICGISLAPARLAAIDRAILGQRPSYGPASISEVPNLAAIDRLIWMPGLDAGWDPQGLAFAEGALFVSAYKSDGYFVSRGPCRVFRVDPATGAETGHFDVPPPCGHAGGLAYAGAGKLFIADTRILFEVDIARAFAEPAPKFRMFRLGRGVKGAFAVSGDRKIGIGDYEESRPGKVLEFDLAAIAALADGGVLQAAAASAVVPVLSYAQGGAAGPAGTLWVSRSEIGWGVLEKLDAASGQLEARYPVAGGIEGIAADTAGRLWCVSEAGARHLPLRYPFFPLLFRLDPARLIRATSPPN